MSPIEDSFANYRCWAVVGASANPDKYGYKIVKQLQEANYTVYPVNPRLKELEGLPCFASLADLPVIPEVVNVVIPPELGSQVVEDCLTLGIQRIWFQPGADSPEALEKAKAGGMEVLANACILLTYKTWPDRTD